MMTALPGPPATGQMINTNVNKHYPTSKYLKHAPRDLCLVGDDPIQVKRMSGNSLSRLTSSTRVTTELVEVHMPMSEAASHNVQRYWLYCFEASLCLSCFTAEDASQLLCCWQSASASVSFAPIFYVCLPVCHSFLVCMRDGSPNISYFHRWKSNEIMRWWNDADETVAFPTKVFGVSDHDGDRPV